MLSERDYVQEPRRTWRLSATIVLVALNIIAYLVQTRVIPEAINERYLELSLSGLLHGYFWQLLTYQFMHGGWPHLLLNCWALFIFGRAVESTVGKARFLILYFSAGIIGGLFQMVAALLWPNLFGGAAVGASAGVYGVVAAFAILFPDQRLVMLLFYVIPINMRAYSLLWIVLVLTTLGISFPHSGLLTSILGKNVAHFAHLGGILTGIAFSRFYFQRIVPPFHPVE